MAKQLSPKQRAFVGFLVSGCGKADAYRSAYLTKTQAREMDSREVARKAYEVYKSEPLRVEHEKQLDELASYVNIDSRRYITMLQNAADKAEAANNFGAMIRAIELIGKHLGYFVERHEIVTKNKTVVEIRASINHMLAASPQLMDFIVKNNPKLVENLMNKKIDDEKKAPPMLEMPMIDAEVVGEG